MGCSSDPHCTEAWPRGRQPLAEHVGRPDLTDFPASCKAVAGQVAEKTGFG